MRVLGRAGGSAGGAGRVAGDAGEGLEGVSGGARHREGKGEVDSWRVLEGSTHTRKSRGGVTLRDQEQVERAFRMALEDVGKVKGGAKEGSGHGDGRHIGRGDWSGAGANTIMHALLSLHCLPHTSTPHNVMIMRRALSRVRRTT
jgi:hypothetical protein